MEEVPLYLRRWQWYLGPSELCLVGDIISWGWESGMRHCQSNKIYLVFKETKLSYFS